MVARKLTVEKAKLKQEADKRAREEMDIAIRDLQEENSRKEELLKSARSAELELRHKARDLEEKKNSLELDVARKIQRSMLPCIFPAFPDREEFEIYATMLPAKEVGGDFYDFSLSMRII
jgi:serine phosphatase RsbU (regulator of sigma subunit)